MDRVPRRRFQTCVNPYHGDRNVQTFKCTDYFRVMAFAQLTYRESLRDIVDTFLQCAIARQGFQDGHCDRVIIGATLSISANCKPGLNVAKCAKQHANENCVTTFPPVILLFKQFSRIAGEAISGGLQSRRFFDKANRI